MRYKQVLPDGDPGGPNVTVVWCLGLGFSLLFPKRLSKPEQLQPLHGVDFEIFQQHRTKLCTWFLDHGALLGALTSMVQIFNLDPSPPAKHIASDILWPAAKFEWFGNVPGDYKVCTHLHML